MLRQHVTTVCQGLGWNNYNLLNSDWEIMEHYRDLLEPFANHNILCSAEDLTSIPNVYTDGADHAP